MPPGTDANGLRTPIDRREMLRRSALVAGSAALLPGLEGLLARRATADAGELPGHAGLGRGGYGPLVRKKPVAAYTRFPGAADLEWIALPEDFHYVVFGVTGDPMSDGNPTPIAHDGMAAFRAGFGRHRLVRNHEDRNGAFASTPIAGSLRAYDPRAAGGTTTLEIRVGRNGVPRLHEAFVSLNGTIVNCAGGPTPAGSWISSEETTENRGGIRHGYNFEVPADAGGPVEPIPLAQQGRFAHEAVAVEPRSGIVYETEDSGDSGFFRFVPHRRGRLDAGVLEMLAVRGERNADLKAGQTVGEPIHVEWVTIPDPDPAEADTNRKAVYRQGIERGAATFGRLEGCWWDRVSRAIVFSCTNGGEAGQGQIWAYTPFGHRFGVLTLLYESPSGFELSFPDNVAASPGGGILLCEDTSFDRPDDPFVPLTWPDPGSVDAIEIQYLRGLTQRGEIFDFAANLLDDREWAGATFSGDGRYLFANTQGTTSNFDPDDRPDYGRTYAIWGPWHRGAFGGWPSWR